MAETLSLKPTCKALRCVFEEKEKIESIRIRNPSDLENWLNKLKAGIEQSFIGRSKDGQNSWVSAKVADSFG